MKEQVGTGIGFLVFLAIFVFLVVVFWKEGAAKNRLNAQNLAIPTLVIVTSDGLLDIKNAETGHSYEIKLVDMIVNPNQIVSFKDITTNKRFPKSSLIVLGSAYSAGKAGTASDRLVLHGVSKDAIIEYFTKARKAQLIPGAR